MKRPDRQNYPNGVFGDIAYDERLERYCSYLENQNKRLRIADVVRQSEQLKAFADWCDKQGLESIEWSGIKGLLKEYESI